MNLLRFGSSGSEVRQLQELLNKRLDPSPRLRIDGIFGRRTEDAVLRYQATVEIGIDGVVGPRTWAALERGAITELVIDKNVPPSPQDSPWMAAAKKEIGQKERDPGHNPRILQYNTATELRATADEVAWCSAFVNWCLREVGIAGTNNALAISWLRWGRPTVAKMGAITVLQRISTRQPHVGFLVEETTEHFRVLGGNQSHQVKSSDFKKTAYVALGHRWPL